MTTTATATNKNTIDEVRLVDSATPNRIVKGLDAVNAVLSTVGVSIRDIASVLDHSELDEATAATFHDLRNKSRGGAVLHPRLEAPLLLEYYKMSRRAQIEEACTFSGREAAVTGGGSLTTEEMTAPPYPKVYDLASMGPPETRGDVYRKFGTLHVNKTIEGVGVDEVMMILSSSSVLTWFFQNSKGNGVLKLLIPRIGNINNTQGLCLSYPGLTPHGACLEPSTGIIVASITGPVIWEMITKGDGF